MAQHSLGGRQLEQVARCLLCDSGHCVLEAIVQSFAWASCANARASEGNDSARVSAWSNGVE